ncbi:MAG: 2-amino-4-hydroxy-6-hydroxymethyldihydropteridine diphosphokinase [Pseudomonadota bacterium]|nr:2-amino-4-hydroxy-6-hydroxymethyldihydropteridine diphosphokinase [Pseudomonadota bacterium]
MIILGLGSNRGDRRAQLAAAAGRLSALIGGMRCSRLFESQAMLPAGAPPEWNMPYLNMAISGEYDLSPQALLAQIKAMEGELGRVARGHWGPREIDIDILAAGKLVLDTPTLTIPHRELLNRDFSLLPLIEVAPEWRYPVPGPYYQWKAADIAAARGFVIGDALREAGNLHD